MNDVRRQFRAAAILILIIVPIGIAGYMFFEGKTLFEAIYLTIITLTTIGYGDVVPATELGRVFTLALVFAGLGALAFFSLFIIRPALQSGSDGAAAQLSVTAED